MPTPFLWTPSAQAQLQFDNRPDPCLQAALRESLAAAGMSGKRAMLFDLTDQAGPAKSAAQRQDQFGTAASISKLAIAFAGLALLDEVRHATKSLNQPSFATVISAIRAAWQRSDRAEVADLAAKRAPAFGRIFNLDYFNTTGQVAFSTGRRNPLHPSDPPTAALSDEELTQLHEGGVTVVKTALPWLGFEDRMRGMLRDSDNQMASACARDLGFPYLSTLLQHVGLATNSGGLWVGSEYGGGAGTAYPEPAYGVHKLLGVQHGGTARSVATLLALAERKDLGTLGSALIPWLGGGGPLERGAQTAGAAVSSDDKIGILGTSWYGDAAVLRMTLADGRRIRLVLVALDAPAMDDLEKLGQEIATRLPMCRPASGWLKSLLLEPQYPPGGTDVHAKLELRLKAPKGGLKVFVTTNRPECVVVKSPVMVTAGKLSFSLVIRTLPVDADTNFAVTASDSPMGGQVNSGGTVKSAQIREILIPKKTPGKRKGNIGRIVLTGRAGPRTRVTFGGATSPIERVTNPVEIEPGATKAEFTYDTADVSSDRAGNLVGSLNGSIISAWTTVVPAGR